MSLIYSVYPRCNNIPPASSAWSSQCNGPKTTCPRNFLNMLPMATARSSSDDNAIRYVLQVLWMTSCLSIIGQAKATQTGRILKVTHQRAARGRSLMSTIVLLHCRPPNVIKLVSRTIVWLCLRDSICLTILYLSLIHI